MSKASITSISLPPLLQKELEREAKNAHLSKSGFIQETIRFYLENKRWKKVQRDISERALRAGIGSEDDVEAMIDEIRR